jgi:hypothetical protein
MVKCKGKIGGPDGLLLGFMDSRLRKKILEN